jgi:formamidopyrimidine-DNA glycosylase
VIRRVIGQRVTAVERRGKHQLVTLADGSTLLIHFRLNGDWDFGRGTPAHARVTIELDNGRCAVLTDPRALCTVTWHAADQPPLLDLGPEPEDAGLTPTLFRARLAARRSPIKPTLLDQSLVAGVGNIYAAEACWHAAIAPTAPARSLSLARVTRLLAGLRTALADGHINAARYHTGERTIPFKVYDREGEPCRRCGRAIKRIVQAGRGTWYCPGCQKR